MRIQLRYHDCIIIYAAAFKARTGSINTTLMGRNQGTKGSPPQNAILGLLSRNSDSFSYQPCGDKGGSGRWEVPSLVPSQGWPGWPLHSMPVPDWLGSKRNPAVTKLPSIPMVGSRTTLASCPGPHGVSICHYHERAGFASHAAFDLEGRSFQFALPLPGVWSILMGFELTISFWMSYLL